MPFMTENIYQSLQTRNSAARDTRSVHFLRFPAVKEDYIDTDIERQVKQMQAVIDLARNVREWNNFFFMVCMTISSTIVRDYLLQMLLLVCRPR